MSKQDNSWFDLFQILFERFAVGNSYSNLESVLALFASGEVSGLVVTSGHSQTNCVAVYDGHCIQNGIASCTIAGSHITEKLQSGGKTYMYLHVFQTYNYQYTAVLLQSDIFIEPLLKFCRSICHINI